MCEAGGEFTFFFVSRRNGADELGAGGGAQLEWRLYGDGKGGVLALLEEGRKVAFVVVRYSLCSAATVFARCCRKRRFHQARNVHGGRGATRLLLASSGLDHERCVLRTVVRITKKRKEARERGRTMGSVSEEVYSGVRSFVPRSIIWTFSRYPGAKVRSNSRERVVMTVGDRASVRA